MALNFSSSPPSSFLQKIRFAAACLQGLSLSLSPSLFFFRWGLHIIIRCGSFCCASRRLPLPEGERKSVSRYDARRSMCRESHLSGLSHLSPSVSDYGVGLDGVRGPIEEKRVSGTRCQSLSLPPEFLFAVKRKKERKRPVCFSHENCGHWTWDFWGLGREKIGNEEQQQVRRRERGGVGCITRSGSSRLRWWRRQGVAVGGGWLVLCIDSIGVKGTSHCVVKFESSPDLTCRSDSRFLLSDLSGRKWTEASCFDRLRTYVGALCVCSASFFFEVIRT